MHKNFLLCKDKLLALFNSWLKKTDFLNKKKCGVELTVFLKVKYMQKVPCGLETSSIGCRISKATH